MRMGFRVQDWQKVQNMIMIFWSVMGFVETGGTPPPNIQ